MDEPRFRYVLFDLDGTLNASAPGITRAVQRALSAAGIEVPDPDSLISFVGPPLVEEFRRRYGLDDDTVARCIRAFREYYEARGIHENSMYPGAVQMLRRLKERGILTAIASSKPEHFVEHLMEYFGISDLITVTAGSLLNDRPTAKGEKTDKQIVVERVLENFFLLEKEAAGEDEAGADTEQAMERLKSRAVMVGDRSNDIEGAHAAGIRAVGVLYGYGNGDELRGSGADRIVKNIAELEGYLLGEA